jgi:hypothetical protein
MKFSFEVKEDISMLLPSVKRLILAEGGNFNGTEQNGIFQGKGIRGNYSINEKTINIMIVKKPPFVDDKKIKDEIMNYFKNK